MSDLFRRAKEAARRLIRGLRSDDPSQADQFLSWERNKVPDQEFRSIGRGSSYVDTQWRYLQSEMRLVQSSNVYSYGYEAETPQSGILYVQFLNWTPSRFGGDGSRNGPGPTYAYYNFPLAKYLQFERATEASAGKAVWDFCRIRGTSYGHQHTYRLIQTTGDYVPRKATKAGFAKRTPAAIGIGKRNIKGQLPLQQLAPMKFAERRTANRQAFPPRGSPNRGEPNRGEPNRGN